MLASLPELKQLEGDLQKMKIEHFDLYDKLCHIASLTRQLHIQYGYLGSLFMKEGGDAKQRPKFVRRSVLSLYQNEVEKVASHPDIHHFKTLLVTFRDVGYPKTFLLLLGAKPESISGTTFIK